MKVLCGTFHNCIVYNVERNTNIDTLNDSGLLLILSYYYRINGLSKTKKCHNMRFPVISLNRKILKY
jgi:hypothetical protein